MQLNREICMEVHLLIRLISVGWLALIYDGYVRNQLLISIVVHAV